MENTIKWSTIKNQYRGFEKLAVDYVNDMEKTDHNWSSTQATHDGNRDAHTIILGYSADSGSETEWWMEAKCSFSKINLSRYRLDATIVSAILKGNVSKIIFVTNIHIKSKAILDIQKALMEATICEKVFFYTKEHLEYWLLLNYERYCTYFPPISKEDFIKLDYPQLLAIEAPEFFPVHAIFKEPIMLLYSNHFYNCSLSLFSPQNRVICLSCSNSNLSFIGKNNKKTKSLKIDLEKGVNSLEIQIYIEQNLTKNHDKGLCFKIKGEVLELFPESTVTIADNRGEELTIKNQEEIVKQIDQSWKFYCKGTQDCVFHQIVGKSGSGKSFIVQKFLDGIFQYQNQFFIASFFENQLSNQNLLVEMVFYLLFPYLPPQELDEEYLSELNHLGSKKDILIKIKHASRNIDDFLAISCDSFTNMLFPSVTQIQPRAIILDDIHKLKSEYSELLFFMFDYLKLNGYPLFVILIGQDQYPWMGLDDFQKKNVILKHQLKLEWNDLLSYVLPMEVGFSADSAKVLFGSVIEFLYFMKHSYLLKDKITTIDQFLLSYHNFKNVAFFREYVLSQFRDSFKRYKDPDRIQNICVFIYYTPEELPISALQPYRLEIESLLHAGIVKVDSNSNVVPFHDIYKDVFCHHYKAELSVPLEISISYISQMQWDIMTKKNEASLAGHLLEIDGFLERQAFHTVYSLLYHVFQDEEHRENYKNISSPHTFCRLFFNYAYAAANVSQLDSGNQIFSMVWEAASGSDDSIIAIRALTEFELLNSAYENLDFKKAKFYYDAFQRNLMKLPKSTPFLYQNRIKTAKLAAKSVRLLMKIEDEEIAELGVLRMKEYHEIFGTTEEQKTYCFELLRIAMALLGSDFDTAWKLIGICKRFSLESSKSKAFLLTDFAYQYLNFTIMQEGELNQVINAHISLKKDFHNDYRRHLLAMANLYYFLNLNEEGDSCLLEVSEANRPLRPRQSAINHTCKALAGLRGLQKDKLRILDELNCAKKILKEFSSYVKIINHNIKYLQTKFKTELALDFYYGQEMSSDCYYIDSRFIY